VPSCSAECVARCAQADRTAARRSVRLRDALLKDGDSKQAAALTTLLNNAERTREIAPSRIERSKALFAGEELTKNTPLPVDRETSAPLAEIIFPETTGVDAPLFDERVSSAVASIVEEWSNMDALLDVGVHPAQTCLIYGAPGTGTMAPPEQARRASRSGWPAAWAFLSSWFDWMDSSPRSWGRRRVTSATYLHLPTGFAASCFSTSSTRSQRYAMILRKSARSNA